MGNTVLVIAPHADDEVLGAGGTIARFAAEGARITVAILTAGFPPDFPQGEEEMIRQEAVAAHKILGVSETVYLDFPAAAIDSTPHRELNRAMASVYRQVSPDYVLVPFIGDVHLDHQAAFQSAMVMCRPNGGHAPRNVLAYETVSETNWNAPLVTPGFQPNTYVDISNYLERKLDAFRAYASQVRPYPNERSIESLRAMAILRGTTVHLPAAEAFISVRHILADTSDQKEM